MRGSRARAPTKRHSPRSTGPGLVTGQCVLRIELDIALAPTHLRSKQNLIYFDRELVLRGHLPERWRRDRRLAGRHWVVDLLGCIDEPAVAPGERVAVWRWHIVPQPIGVDL